MMKEEDNNPSINSDLSSPKSVVDLTFSFQVLGLHNISRRSTMIVEYSSLIRDAAGNLSEDQVLSGRFKFNLDELPVDVIQKLKSLEKVVVPFLSSYKVGTNNFDSLTLGPSIREILCSYRTKPQVNIPMRLTVTYSFPTAPSQTKVTNLQWDLLSRSQQLLVSNIALWVKNKAWEHLANQVRKVSGQPALSSRSHKIFISYKKNSSAENIAEHIALRLSQQGINVWFDKWEVRTGDSILGKIGEGFVGIDACLIFLSYEYNWANWCTSEMNIALSKAISEDLIIIPSLVEPCDVPELFKDLRRVDFIEPTAAEFEKKLQEITDSIYKVDLNPYR